MEKVAIVVLVLVIVCILCRIAKSRKFDENYSNKPSFCLFYAPWCPHCKTIMPAFEKLQKALHGVSCGILKINCEEQKELAKKHGVKGYPTMRFLPRGVDEPEWYVEYSGNRSYGDMKKFVEDQVKGMPAERVNESANTDGSVLHLTHKEPNYRFCRLSL